MNFLLAWFINAISLLILPYLIPFIEIRSFSVALVAALILGLLNTFVRPILILLTLPVTVLTLGLFLVVINAFLFWFTSYILGGFEVTGFMGALIASLLYSLISLVLSTLLLNKK